MMKKTKLPLLCLALIAGMLLFGPWTASANQPPDHPDTAGTDFWLAFAQSYDPVVLSLFITSDVDTTGTVEVPGLTFSTSFSVTAGTVTTVSVPANAQLNGADTTEDKGIHVTAEDEITVYGLNRRAQTTDAYLGLPTNILGTEYVALSYENSYAHNGTQLAIVATVDNTTVTIIPSVTTEGHTAGVSYDVTLNRGQTYQLRNSNLSASTPPPSPPGPPFGPVDQNLMVDTALDQARRNQRQEVNESPVDLSGTIITATEPIAVFGGSQCANIPALVSACDHIVEQLTPTSTWGKSFVTMPLATRTKGDTFRFLAATDNTTVNVNGSDVATINRGELHEMVIEGAAQITANEPILVAQYSNSSQFDGVTSDPFMMLIPPYEQFLASYTVTTPATGFAQNFVNLVVPDAAVGAVTLDGTAIPAGDYVAIGSSGFSGTQVTVSAGSHALAGPQPFGTFMYGFDSYDSYGYPGGASLAEVATITKLTLTPPTATNPVDNEHCVIATVTDQNDDPVPGVRVDFVVTGVNPTSSFATADENGQAEFCYTGANAGADTITASVGDLSDDATANWEASPPPDLSISKDDGQTTINPGDTLIYTITASNTSATDATGVVVSDTLPAHTTFVSASDGGSEASGVVTWNVGTLNGGASVSRTVTVQVNDPLPDDVEEITNSASVADDGSNGVDPTPGNNSDSDVDGVQKDPDLVIPAVDRSDTTTDAQALTISGNVSVQLRNQDTSDVSDPFQVKLFEDRDGDGLLTAGDNLLGEQTHSSAIAAGESDTISIAVSGDVLFRDNLIYAFADSENVIAESQENNNYNNSGASCEFHPPVNGFDPQLEWEWTESSTSPTSKQVVMTPAVIDLTDDGIPDVIFITHVNRDLHKNGHLRAINGHDGSEIFNVTDSAYDLYAASTPAVGDIDLDGQPEILAMSESSEVLAFSHDGSFKWRSAVISGDTRLAGPAIADLDQDGTPEIVVGATVLNHDGSIRWSGSEGRGDHYEGPLSLVADLDLAGTPEVVAGNTAYRADGTVYWHNSSVTDGFNAIGNFDDDAFPEIALVTQGKVYLLEHDGNVKWGPSTIPGGGRGGAPTIADVDGDGQPEIGVAGGSNYVVFETDGTLKWSQPVQDASSNVTGSSVFDFEGDGSAEVVYSDELKLYIYRGSDGTVLWETPSNSRTGYENPVIVDVDADGNAEIVIVTNNAVQSGTTGIQVYGDANDTWVPTRQIWNQHTYHITNVNDDGTIPQNESASWQTHNTYRLNLPTNVATSAAPDLTASQITVNDADFPSSATITARIGNGGAIQVGAGVEVAFYDGDPQDGGRLIAVTTTTQPLAPGEYEDVTITWDAPPNGEHTIYVVADDDGTGEGAHNECDETNNDHSVVHTFEASCEVEVDFNAQLEWQWTESSTSPTSKQVVMTPAVIDLTDDGIPDVVFITHVGVELHKDGHLRAINGEDGSEIFSVTDSAYDLYAASNVAVGDIDLDGQPEILAMSESSEVLAFSHDGSFKWRSPVISGDTRLAGPAIADLDQDGTPEIVVGATVLNHDGTIRWSGSQGRGDNYEGPLSLVADLDQDGTPEVVAGNTAYHSDGTVYWHNSSVTDGFNAIGNFDDDAFPEIALVTEGEVYLLEHDGNVKWGPSTIPGGGRGGAPTIADVDGDGEVEIGVAGGNNYVVFETDGTVKWSQPIQDASSNVTGSSVFDFDRDGSAEVVYSDELNLYIYRGSDGTVLWQTSSNSRTGYENPVIVDVDADGNAEIVMVTNNAIQSGTTGIQVYGHSTWPGTRGIWNQHSYHITNINDDGTIPQNESNSWQEHNTYRLNPSDGCGDEPPSACTASFSADSKHMIDQDFDGSISVYPADIDGDGDVDVLGAAQYADDIALWKNDGSGTLTKHLIDDNFDGAFSVYADDVDQDGDLDVLGAAFGTNQVAWWANNGDDSWTKHVIGTGTLGAYSVRTGDLDGDGDRDAVGAFVDDKIVWWANNGDSLSWTEHVIDTDFDGAQAVEVADLDGDGDMDVLGASRYGNEITWWENSGNGSSWTEHLIDDYFRYSVSIQAADVDGDGDLDLLGAATTSDDITWWENDGNAAGWTEHLIDGEFDGASWVNTADMDKDGDLDVLGAGRDGGGEISWWENDGSGTSWTKHLVDDDFDGAHSVFAADMDGDDDLDLLGAAYRADDVAWWGNDCTTGGTTLILDPPTETMRVSETITIDVMVNDVVDLRTVQFKLEFNQDVLEVVDADTGTDGLQITPGSCPQSDLVVVNAADNSTGVIEYSATSFNASCSPNGVVAQIAFHAHAEGKGWVKFTSWDLSKSLGQTIEVDRTTGSSIMVEDERTGNATGTVRLVGREIHWDTGQPYYDGASIKVIDGDETVIATATTNAAGEYELADIPAGTYTVKAEMNLYLYAERSLVVEHAQTTALPHLNLWPGDNNGDNKVNILDLQPLFQLFDAGESFSAGMTCDSPPAWSPSTEALQAKLDFNADCEIDVGDMALHSTTISAFFAGNGPSTPVGLNVPVVPLTPGAQALAPTPWE